VTTDMFSCGNGNAPCNLGYKLYCDLFPADTVGLANPIDGWPAYRAKASRYLSDAQISGNYPDCGNMGAGNNWYMIWDGQTDSGTADHAGWYGAQAQRVFFNELGNSLSFNCLPVTGASACFAALSDLGQFNDTTRRDGSALSHEGGISPVPVPQFEGRIDSIAAVFEGVTNKVIRDAADDPVTSVDLLWMTDNPGATDLDWAANGQLLATLPADATEFKMLRSDPFIRDGKFFMLATRINYAGGYSSFLSANSGTFNELQDLECYADADDTAAIVNLQQVCFAVRKDDFGKEFLIILMDIEGAPLGQVLTDKAKYAVVMNTEGGIANMQVRGNALAAAKTRGGPTVLRFNTNFDNTGDADGLVSENSTFDEAPDRGWIMFGVPLSELVDAFGGGSIAGAPGTRTVTFSGSSRVPTAIDTFPDGGGEISFTF